MIVYSLSLAMHILISSLKAFGPTARAVEYLLPYYRNMSTKAIKGKNVNSKHLQHGDPLPPYNGTLRVYNMRYCPYAQRTILVLNAKQVDYEVVNINLANKPEWLPSKSPFGKVPAIEIKDGVTIYESLVTAEYLDDVFPQRPLRAKDPLRRAEDRLLIEHIGLLQSALFKLLKMPEKVTDDTYKTIFQTLDRIQNELNARATPFLGGSEPGFVDYMIWPWFERLPLINKAVDQLEFDLKKYKILSAYIDTMKKDPAISQYLIDDDVYVEYFKTVKNNTPRYDFLDDK